MLERVPTRRQRLNLWLNAYGFTGPMSSRRSASSAPEGPYEIHRALYRCEERPDWMKRKAIPVHCTRTFGLS
jgi:hypothetical protein